MWKHDMKREMDTNVDDMFDWLSLLVERATRFNHIQFACNLRGKYYDVVYVPHEHRHTNTHTQLLTQRGTVTSAVEESDRQ